VDQQLRWSLAPDSRSVSFALYAPATDPGIAFRGDAVISGDLEVRLRFALRNTQAASLLEGHHTLRLDLSTLPEFQAPDSARTFLMTADGWRCFADLAGGADQTSATLLVAERYAGTSLTHRVIAKTAADGQSWLAFHAEHAYAFAGNHPEWPWSLVVGCRWPDLGGGQEQQSFGLLSCGRGGLDAIPRDAIGEPA
jgi:hypothetical protein